MLGKREGKGEQEDKGGGSPSFLKVLMTLVYDPVTVMSVPSLVALGGLVDC